MRGWLIIHDHWCWLMTNTSEEESTVIPAKTLHPAGNQLRGVRPWGRCSCGVGNSRDATWGCPQGIQSQDQGPATRCWSLVKKQFLRCSQLSIFSGEWFAIDQDTWNIEIVSFWKYIIYIIWIYCQDLYWFVRFKVGSRIGHFASAQIETSLTVGQCLDMPMRSAHRSP